MNQQIELFSNKALKDMIIPLFLEQLLVMLDRGLSNRDIAEQLQISEHTVKVHLWRLFRRLNVKSRSQASHLARTQGLL